MKTSLIKSLVVNGSTDDLSIDDFSVLLGADGQGICHQVVDRPGISLGKTVRSCKCCRVNDGGRGTGQLKLVEDVL